MRPIYEIMQKHDQFYDLITSPQFVKLPREDQIAIKGVYAGLAYALGYIDNVKSVDEVVAIETSIPRLCPKRP
jgi:hypothetical protein